ncbi:unnamed protein product [Cyprideis torosa]|uniref:Uncharacterized protein n=1 Tax=Cyprideis torosa TaxID=163714 RepID=A0A7R8W2C0_9CRUS|nr:unnamed protein product [Cyprideis torosa]CAG0880843.1 unnamed protein product [Cyprideis torosa]
MSEQLSPSRVADIDNDDGPEGTSQLHLIYSSSSDNDDENDLLSFRTANTEMSGMVVEAVRNGGGAVQTGGVTPEELSRNIESAGNEATLHQSQANPIAMEIDPISDERARWIRAKDIPPDRHALVHRTIWLGRRPVDVPRSPDTENQRTVVRQSNRRDSVMEHLSRINGRTSNRVGLSRSNGRVAGRPVANSAQMRRSPSLFQQNAATGVDPNNSGTTGPRQTIVPTTASSTEDNSRANDSDTQQVSEGRPLWDNRNATNRGTLIDFRIFGRDEEELQLALLQDLEAQRQAQNPSTPQPTDGTPTIHENATWLSDIRRQDQLLLLRREALTTAPFVHTERVTMASVGASKSMEWTLKWGLRDIRCRGYIRSRV